MFTRKDLERLKKEGKIRDFKLPAQDPAKVPAKKKISPQKKWINVELHEWGMKYGVMINKEHNFAVDRSWRFDWAFIIEGDPDIKVAIEYEGINAKKSRHTTKSGFTEDTAKYNKAQELGWKVYRYTAKSYQELTTVLDNLTSVLKNRKQ